jgi:uncharacterized protein YdaU (DUF1376 family)
VSDGNEGSRDTSRAMGESAPAFQLYVRDWIVSTAYLTDEQSGAYMRLLCHAWEANGLPVDEEEIQQLGRWTNEQWARIWPKVKTKWQKRGSRLVNPRQELERDGLKRYKEAAARGGRRSAEVRSAQRDNQRSLNDTSKQAVTTLQPTGNTASALASVKQETTSRPPIVDPSSLVISHGQAKATVEGLIGAWNNVAAAHPPLVEVKHGSSPSRVTMALAMRPDINWWADVFAKLTKSDYCMGRKQAPAFTFWKALDKAEKIATGDYDNWAEKPKVARKAETEWRPVYKTVDEIEAEQWAIADARNAEFAAKAAAEKAKAGTH